MNICGSSSKLLCDYLATRFSIADRTVRIVIEPCPRFEPRFEPWDLAIHYGVRLTFWPRNYIWSFSYGFGVVVRDLGEWRPGFYSEFRYKSYEHSGLAWGAIFKKCLFWSYFQDYHVHFSRNKFPKLVFPNVPTRKGAWTHIQIHIHMHIPVSYTHLRAHET